MAFLSTVAQCHPDNELTGDQAGSPTSQVRAVYAALAQANMRYVNSLLDFSPDESASTQRVRLPREVLKQGQANCLDLTLLFASLLEAINLHPAIVIVPKHALIGWQVEPGNEDSDNWQYLETTYITTHSFDEAVRIGTLKAKEYEAQQVQADTHESTRNDLWFRRWSLRQLRAEYGITPLE